MNEVINALEGNYEKSMRETVLSELRKAIFTRKVKPGERLIETTIANSLGVSRTPVREALRQLESEGLAVNIPRRGTIVKGICYEDAAEMYDIREVLEGLAVRSACLNISRLQIRRLKEIVDEMADLISDVKDEDQFNKLHDEYNKIILEASNNKRLLVQLESIHEYLKSLRLVSLLTKDRKDEAVREHRDIVEAIEKGDETNAELVARKHVKSAKRSFEETIKQHEDNEE